MSAREIILDADVTQKHVGSADWNFSLDTSGKLLIVVRRQNVVELLNAAQFQKQVGEKLEIGKEAPRKPQDNLVAESLSQPADRPAPSTPAPASGSLVNEPTSNVRQAPSQSSSADSPFPAPMIEEVEVEMEVGTGKNKRLEIVTLMQVEGTALSVSAVEKSKKNNLFMALVIAGLPDADVPENRTLSPHDQFHCFHQSLFDALKTVKPGKSRIVFQYKSQTIADDPKKIVWQHLEGISSVDGVGFDDGKPVKAEAKAAVGSQGGMFSSGVGNL